jgi:glycosyltransferase involved in cell wall biosynthesis
MKTVPRIPNESRANMPKRLRTGTLEYQLLGGEDVSDTLVSGDTDMIVLFFGTYDARSHPRVAVLQEGLRAHGCDVRECNVPLGLDAAARVRMLRRPWLFPRLVARLAPAWWRLWRAARQLDPPDAVVIGYMGHFDIHLARRLWPGVLLVLDYLVSGRDTAIDRGIDGPLLIRALDRLDRRALAAADLRVMDTVPQLEIVPEELRAGSVIVPVGASDRWFQEPRHHQSHRSVRVVFFGVFTPLHGAPTIGRAIGLLAGEPRVRFTLIGSGQDYRATRELASANPNVEWLLWVSAEELPGLVAEHDICLGIFGTGPKAQRVVPTKVSQGAAAGCAIVTSDTPAQRGALDGAAELVPPGNPEALAETLVALAEDPARLWRQRCGAYERARAEFTPPHVVEPLVLRLRGAGAGRAAAVDRARA